MRGQELQLWSGISMCTKISHNCHPKVLIWTQLFISENLINFEGKASNFTAESVKTDKIFSTKFFNEEYHE